MPKKLPCFAEIKIQGVFNEELRVEEGVGGIVLVERNSTRNGKLDTRFERAQFADVLKVARLYDDKIGDIYSKSRKTWGMP